MSWRRIITGKTRKRPSRTSGSCWFARNGEFRAILRRPFTLTRFQSDITRLLRHVRAILSHLLSQSCREVNVTPWLMCYVSFTLSSFVLIAKTTHLIPRNVVWTLWLGSITTSAHQKTLLFCSHSCMFCFPTPPARVWWMNPCVWERASISCAGEAARSSQQLITEGLIMQTHGWCSLLIKPCVRMTRAVVNTGVTRNPNYDPLSPANAMEATRHRQVRAPIVHRHNNETLVSANTMSERCLIVSNHNCVSSDLWTGPFWTYKWIKPCGQDPVLKIRPVWCHKGQRYITYTFPSLVTTYFVMAKTLIWAVITVGLIHSVALCLDPIQEVVAKPKLRYEAK